ncbi:MAG: hypothetical protein QM762_25790 [Chryseolinea sp.]
MPTKFNVDSLTVLKDLFGGIKIKHIDDNMIEVRSTEDDLVPFAGVLEAKNDTIFFREKEEKPGIPYLILNAPKFDTLHVRYKERRVDEVVALGKIYDTLSKDSLYAFALRPLRRMSSNESIYLRRIALKRGEGIRYLTFGKDQYNVTIAVTDQPKVIANPIP